MRHLHLFLLFVMVFLAAAPGGAQYYRYVDKNGQERFTDDPTQIPSGDTEKLESYEELPAGTPEAKPTAETPSEGKQTLEERQSALDEEYTELSVLRTTLEKEKEAITTAEELSGYKEKLTEFNRRTADYNEKRKTLEKEAAQYPSVAGNTDPVPEMVDTDPIDISVVQALRNEKMVLDKTRDGLEKERDTLVKEKEILDGRRKSRMLRPDAEALKNDTIAFEKRKAAYMKQMEAFETETKEFNLRVEAAGLGETLEQNGKTEGF